MKGIEIEPALQNRSHCTPPPNSCKHDERPVPQRVAPTIKGSFAKTHACGDPQDPLRLRPVSERSPRARGVPPDPLRWRVDSERSPKSKADPSDPLRQRSNTKKCLQARVDPPDSLRDGPSFKKSPFPPTILGQQPPQAPPPPTSPPELVGVFRPSHLKLFSACLGMPEDS